MGFPSPKLENFLQLRNSNMSSKNKNNHSEKISYVLGNRTF